MVNSCRLAPEALLEQGDILRDCPRFGIEGLDHWPPPDDAEVDVAADLVRAVVLTQTRDLFQRKVGRVLLAVVVPWPDAREATVARGHQAARSSRFREALVQGNLLALALLHRHAGAPPLDGSVVDFHLLLVFPKSLVVDIAAANGLRLRLASPDKEHQSQAFARYLMRVGRPHDAKAFVKGGAEESGSWLAVVAPPRHGRRRRLELVAALRRRPWRRWPSRPPPPAPRRGRGGRAASPRCRRSTCR